MNNYMITPNKSIYGKTDHPTEKPEILIQRLIEASTNKGCLVGDFFLGSGTTCVVAKKLKRNYFGTELKKEYFEIAQKRLNDVNVYKDILYYSNKKEKTLLDY